MTVYKILCEVRWLHEYYCTLDKGETIFEKVSQADRNTFLFDRFVSQVPSVTEDLEFTALPLNQVFNDHYVHVLPTYSGFKLAVKCVKEVLSDGTIAYRPFIDLPDALCFRVMIREKKNILRFSGETSSQPIKPLWFFSSSNIPAAKIFPFLSSGISAFLPGQPYVQSEIALHAGVAKVFLNNGALDPWLSLPGIRYINTNDSHLLPLSFVYTFNELENITSAVFVLKDAASTTIKKIVLATPRAMRSVTIDLHTPEEKVKTIRYSGVTPDLLYTLEVTGSGSYSKTFNNLLFADDVLQPEVYSGVIDLQIKPTITNFQLLDGSGLLKTRILPGGIKQAPPIFELWMKSKYAFWQYANNRQKKFKLTPATTDLLKDNGGVLVLKNPVPMSFTPRKLKKPDSSFQILPNPKPENEAQRDGNKILLNMLVPDSNLFPLL